MINISKAKANFILKYPETTFAKILVSEPDHLKESEFLAKVETWLKILTSEKIEKGGG